MVFTVSHGEYKTRVGARAGVVEEDISGSEVVVSKFSSRKRKSEPARGPASMKSPHLLRIQAELLYKSCTDVCCFSFCPKGEILFYKVASIHLDYQWYMTSLTHILPKLTFSG